MRQSRDVPVSEQNGTPDELERLRAAESRDRLEILSLSDTVRVYREGASSLALEIVELRAELARARALSTRRIHQDAASLVEIRLACDELASDVVALVVAETFEDTHSPELVEAWQLIASRMTAETVRHCDASREAMLRLRIKDSRGAVSVEAVVIEPASGV